MVWFLPIAPKHFEKAFSLVGINQRLNQKCSWTNYIEYLENINSIKSYLEQRFDESLDLLKAHSFLFTLSYEKYDKAENVSNRLENFDVEIIDPKPRESKPVNSKGVDTHSVTSLLDVQKRKIEIGNVAEQVVLEYEQLKLSNSNNPELATKVTLDPSNNPMAGYDIESFNLDGQKIRIEVKAVSGNRFIITRQEVKKAKELENYYLYLVNVKNNTKPSIKIIKDPIFYENVMFELYPLSYEAKFK